MLTTTTLICLAIGANGHGYMTKPPSRQAEAFEANGWPNEVAERASASSPHTPMYAIDAKITQADHGGVPQFRLCDDEGLVSAVTTPGYEPTVADHEALEQCLQRGLLRCDGVDGNDCSQVAECDTYAKDWEACADKGKYLHCSGGAPGERGCKNTAETCAHGTTARYKLKIPESTKASAHTILSYRWDTYENNEVFVGCADIAITTDGDAAPVTPRPTKAPTKEEIVTPKPTPRPTTKDGVEWNCAGYSQSCHRIDHNNGDAFKALGSTTSWGSEAVCANKGKKARWSTHWCPKQELTCTKAKSCRRLDGKTGKMSTTTKWKQSKCLAQGETARWTTAWCPADVETPKPTSAKQDEPCCRATGDRADITDEWCESVSCAPVYVEGGFCTRACDGPAPGPAPGPVPTTPRPTSRPATPRPTRKPTTPRPTPRPATPRPTPRPADDGPCECRARGDRPDVTDEWCQTVSCVPAYASVCTVCDGPAPGPGPAPAPAPGPAPGPATPRPTKKPTTPRPTIKGEEGPFEVIAGYVENWRAWDTSQYDSFTHLLYSFLTLDSRPNPDQPRDIGWNGEAIYETMTLADVLEVMQLCDGCQPYDNPHNWQRVKIVALMDYCAAKGKKFVWAFGGWSDLKRTISDGQVDLVVSMLVELLETVGGDGIDFDWEHLSAYKDIDPGLHAQQRLIVGKVIVALKDALVAKGMGDRIISYTPRYNAFWADRAYGSAAFRTDGEGIDVVNYVRDNSPYGVDAIDYVHFMMYDINAQEGFPGAPEEYFVRQHYDYVIDSLSKYIPPSKAVIGFEPGPQAYTGVSGGVEHEKAMIAHLNGKVGGIMFWAVNEGASGGPNGNGQTTGQNSVALANYAAAL